ncbi:MAG: ABC transporter substrate-binding protein [Chloroflexi bacterium]|nr:ABC transporter substrate-binding protein [Chloroflexota bacterium]
MNRKLFALIALAIVVLAMLAACASPTVAPTAAPQPTSAPASSASSVSSSAAPSSSAPSAAKFDRNIKIGIVDTYSGPPAAYGNDALNGFKLAINEINKDGVGGVKIEFVTRDDKYAPDVALSMAKELVLQEKVDVLVGTVNSAAALAISAYAKEQKIPYIVWIAKSENVTGAQGHRYVFMTSENTAMAGKAGAQGLAKKPYVKYWIAGEDYEYGHALADSTWKNLQALKPGVQLVNQTWWKTGEPDLVPYMTQIAAAKPDAVIFATGGGGMTNAIKTAKSTGLLDKVPAWFHTGTDFTVLKPLGADAPEGLLGTMDYHFYYPDTPANKAFVAAFNEAYKTPPGFPAFHAYVTANLIANAYKKAGALDKEKFIDAIEGLVVPSPAGDVEMRKCDHQAVLPMFFGVTKKTSAYDFPISTDIVAVAGKDVMPSCDDITKLRAK